jgi:hypothetical protein
VATAARHHQRMYCNSTERTVPPLLVVEPDPRFRLLLCVTTVDEFSDFHAVASYNEARALFAEHDFAAIITEKRSHWGKHPTQKSTSPSRRFTWYGSIQRSRKGRNSSSATSRHHSREAGVSAFTTTFTKNSSPAACHFASLPRCQVNLLRGWAKPSALMIHDLRC